MKPQLDKIRAEIAERTWRINDMPYDNCIIGPDLDNPTDVVEKSLAEKLLKVIECQEQFIEKLRKVIECQDAALEEVKDKVGMCIFGSSDTSADPEVAFRQGSHQAWCDTGLIAKEAKAEVLRILEEK